MTNSKYIEVLFKNIFWQSRSVKGQRDVQDETLSQKDFCLT